MVYFSGGLNSRRKVLAMVNTVIGPQVEEIIRYEQIEKELVPHKSSKRRELGSH